MKKRLLFFLVVSLLVGGCSTNSSSPSPSLPDLNPGEGKSHRQTGVPTRVKLSGDFTTIEGELLKSKIKKVILEKGKGRGAYIPMESSSGLSDPTNTDKVETLTYRAEFYRGKRMVDFITMSATPPTGFRRPFYISSILDTFAGTVAENIYQGDIGVSQSPEPEAPSAKPSKKKKVSTKGLPPIPDAPGPITQKKKKKSVSSFFKPKKTHKYTLPPLP